MKNNCLESKRNHPITRIAPLGPSFKIHPTPNLPEISLREAFEIPTPEPVELRSASTHECCMTVRANYSLPTLSDLVRNPIRILQAKRNAWVHQPNNPMIPFGSGPYSAMTTPTMVVPITHLHEFLAVSSRVSSGQRCGGILQPIAPPSGGWWW